MAKWLNQFRENLKNTRIRMIFIIVVIIIVIALVYGISRAFRTDEVGAGARVVGVPTEIQSVPGASKESKEYLKTLLQSNREAAEKALRTGHTEVATLVATPAQTTGSSFAAQSAPQKACCCPETGAAAKAQQEAAKKETLAGIVGQLEKAGDTSPETAAALKKLNAENLTPAQYAKRLAELVKEGKLSPAAAQRLLAAYRKAHGLAAQEKPAALSHNALLNQLPEAAAKELQALAAQGVSPEDYAEKLAQLVKSGAITPEQAKRLLAAYEAEHTKAAAEAQKGVTSGLAQLESQQQAQKAQALQQQLTQQQAELAQQQANQLQAQQQAMQTAISSQVKQLITAWHAPKQSFVGELHPPALTRKAPATTAASGEAGSAAAGATPAAVKSIVKAGSILFAVLDTAVNSDQPGPVMATIVAGKYKGAKLLGSLQVTSDNEGVLLRFDVMSMKKWPDTVPITAVAINPDTARTALASDVDHHYLQRYSALFASSFLEGLGDAIKHSGNTVTNNAGTTTQTFADLNTEDKLLIGLGQVGKSAGQSAQKTFNRKPTVTVNAGIGLGVLFTQDVKEPAFLKTASKETTATSQQEES